MMSHMFLFKGNMENPIKLLITGIPTVQKNDLVVKKIKVKGKYIGAIGHSSRIIKIRNDASVEMYNQYISQGYSGLIDYLINVDFTFYVLKLREPDWDNLPSLYLDAMQGFRIKNNGVVFKILKNDKLVRRGIVEKIVEGDEKYNGKPRTEIEIRPYL